VRTVQISHNGFVDLRLERTNLMATNLVISFDKVKMVIFEVLWRVKTECQTNLNCLQFEEVPFFGGAVPPLGYVTLLTITVCSICMHPEG